MVVFVTSLSLKKAPSSIRPDRVLGLMKPLVALTRPPSPVKSQVNMVVTPLSPPPPVHGDGGSGVLFCLCGHISSSQIRTALCTILDAV